jgi:2'-5' RNA ligase
LFPQNNIAMTGYQDYLIVLSPPENIISRVKKLKDFSYNEIGEYESHYSKAHITVQPWPRKKPVWIEPLIPKLVRDLQTLPPVILDINGFGFFDHQDNPTIYAKLTSTPSTKIWFKLLRRFFAAENSEPHITIARSIPTVDFAKLWPQFKKLEWKEQFSVDKLTILRREMIGHDKIYKVFKEIPFNNKLDFQTFADSKLKAPLLPSNKINIQQISLF